MTTARKTCEKALRALGELNPREPIGNEEARDMLDILNDLMASWAAGGLSYVHTPLKMSEHVPLDPRHHKGLVALLAIAASDEFAPEGVTPDLRRAAKKGWDGLCGEFFIVPNTKHGTPRLTQGGGRGRRI
jgi:hypothetical protein